MLRLAVKQGIEMKKLQAASAAVCQALESRYLLAESWWEQATTIGLDQVRNVYSNYDGRDTSCAGCYYVIADIGTGFKTESSVLKGKYVAWKDYAGSSQLPTDDQGHDTATAGFLVAGEYETGGK